MKKQLISFLIACCMVALTSCNGAKSVEISSLPTSSSDVSSEVVSEQSSLVESSELTFSEVTSISPTSSKSTPPSEVSSSKQQSSEEQLPPHPKADYYTQMSSSKVEIYVKDIDGNPVKNFHCTLTFSMMFSNQEWGKYSGMHDVAVILLEEITNSDGYMLFNLNNYQAENTIIGVRAWRDKENWYKKFKATCVLPDGSVKEFSPDYFSEIFVGGFDIQMMPESDSTITYNITIEDIIE